MSISNWRPENIFYLTILSIAGISGICKLANDANIPEKIQKGIQKLDIGKKKSKAKEDEILDVTKENQANENEAKENKVTETDDNVKVPDIKLQDLEEGDQNGDQNDGWQTNNDYDQGDDKDIEEIKGGKSNHRRTKRNQTKQKQNQKYRKTQRRIKNNGILKIKI